MGQRFTPPQGSGHQPPQYPSRQSTSTTTTPQVTVLTQEDGPGHDSQSATELHIHSILTNDIEQAADTQTDTSQSQWTPITKKH
ncbi:hypothetical protein SARC_05386 [Sphaeroforma arctica JP610]|uniref:Uncharacterized protein n=1 Tax=Sphaeroforma arctica JP610 TaxID=667725 RepID=A0A0L0FZP4_9EUKA|nr:hypothetical protein SARC_05386 [Sphaeroforma arctica JP610]KNC82322.1 hypothetical protein SARC_05386 [Sphaeroforma arctica JP610]|eukprot:XP_014156224.1 hypothetical protein SARC_05386 [Sphaeroforma arctica JP610]